MLSKIRYFSTEARRPTVDFNCSQEFESLSVLMHRELKNLRIIEGGTLGLLFETEIAGRAKVLKTHSFPEGYATLRKEARILKQIYGASINLEYFFDENASSPRCWLVMDRLEHAAVDIATNQVESIISEYTIILEAKALTLDVPEEDSFQDLIAEGERALKNMTDNRLLSKENCARIGAHLAFLKSRQNAFLPCLCHGDLSPNNIMFNGHRLVVIDWEDAFWGIEGYDWLYWLTFFKNRKLLKAEILGKTPWGNDVEVSILTLIILLKCALSFRANTFVTNTLTFDDRIEEVLSLA